MSVKDIKEYYQKVCDDYTEMLTTLNDMEDAFNKNLVSEEQLNQIKHMIEPLKNNYMTLSWVMFLLNKPTRKEKFPVYDKQMTKFKSNLDVNRDAKHVLQEDAQVIEKLKNHSFN